MRAHVVDTRPVPAGVDLAPALSTWTLTGGATYDPVTREITLPGVGASALSPLIRVDKATGVLITTRQWVPSGGDGRRLVYVYRFDEAGQPIAPVVNGTAGLVGVDAWTEAAWSISAATATYLRFHQEVDATRGVPGTRLRIPTVTLAR